MFTFVNKYKSYVVYLHVFKKNRIFAKTKCIMIKKTIKNKGYTLADVAARLNITQQALSYQLQHSDKMSVARLRDIARVIDCDVAELLSDESQDIRIVCPHCERVITLRVVTPDE